MVKNATVALMAALVMVLTNSVRAEKVEFDYTVDPKSTICFLESINEGVQGKLT